MQRIIGFILNNKNSLLYLLLLGFSLIFTIRSHSYHQSKYFNSSKRIVGGVYNTSHSVSSYLHLKEENENLANENKRLREQLANQGLAGPEWADTTATFSVVTARAIKNSIAHSRNYLTINKGSNHGISQDMGVITPNGIIGIIENTSSKYATVQSILNTNSTINAKIKNTDYFGSLIWDGRKTNTVQLVDIPRSVSLKPGDTITTGAMSSIFPENIPIGVIDEYDLVQNKSTYNINVRLFNDMANVGYVYVITNKDRQEILELQNNTENAQ